MGSLKNCSATSQKKNISLYCNTNEYQLVDNCSPYSGATKM